MRRLVSTIVDFTRLWSSHANFSRHIIMSHNLRQKERLNFYDTWQHLHKMHKVVISPLPPNKNLSFFMGKPLNHPSIHPPPKKSHSFSGFRRRKTNFPFYSRGPHPRLLLNQPTNQKEREKNTICPLDLEEKEGKRDREREREGEREGLI